MNQNAHDSNSLDPKVPLDPVLLARARAMRHDAVPAEQKLWYHLRNRRLGGFKFRRQAVVGAFIADFYCDEVKLIVELDGESHAGHEKHDGIRTTLLERDGCGVIRFFNNDVHRFIDAVRQAILDECERRRGPTRPSRAPSPPPSPKGEGGRGDAS